MKESFHLDECHSSSLGNTPAIISFLRNIQMFGFTGTPFLLDMREKRIG
jgi:type I site-specific restriction-modification system R (restriction) subunit